VIIPTSSFLKNVFHQYENEKPAFSNSSGLKRVFEKLRFRDRIGVGGRPNRKNKAAFSDLSGVHCSVEATLPKRSPRRTCYICLRNLCFYLLL